MNTCTKIPVKGAETMKHKAIRRPALIASTALLVISFGLFGCKIGTASFDSGLSSASIVNGLQMSLSILPTGEPDNPEFEVAIRNVGDEDVTLNLGETLANGRHQFPSKISLTLADNE